MSEKWDIGSLRAHAIAKHPEDAAELALLINSIARSQGIFEYHKCLSRDAYKAFSEQRFFEHQMWAGDQQEEWYKACLQSEANLVACVSTVVNAYETFGKLLVNLGLAQNSDNLYKVRNGLGQGELRSLLDKAIKSDWYKYLKAFTNTVKHHNLIAHLTTMSFEERRRGGKVEGFKYYNSASKETEVYEARWVEDALEGAIGVYSSIVACGCELNRFYIESFPVSR